MSGVTGFDRVFEFAPQFGKYQLCIFLLAYFASATIYGPMLTAGVYFQYKPAHRCKTELDPRNASFDNETPIDFKLTTFENKHKNGCYVRPFEIHDMGYCKNLSRSTLTSAENDQFELIKQNLGLTTNNLNGTFENIGGDCIIIGEREDLCEDFIYDSKQLQDTITSENNLVCDRKWISDIITVTSMIGMVIGPTLSGMVADRIGRTMSIVLFCFITFGFSLLTGVIGSYHWTMYAVFRLLSVLGSSGIGITFFVFIMESCGGRFRPRLGLLYITTTIGVGTVLLSLVVMGFRDWQYAQLTLSGCCLIIAFCTRLCDESPRWLYAHNRPMDARQVIKKMGKWSGVDILESQFIQVEKEMAQDNSQDSQEQGTIHDLIKTPLIRQTTLIIMLNQFVRGIINYGFLFQVGRLAGNIYINNIINNLTGIPAFLILCITVDNRYLGRIGNFIGTLYLAAASSFTILVGILIENDLMVNIASYVGMFASTAATSVGYVYTAEVYPTQVRNVGVGCCSSAAMSGALVSPLMAILGDHVDWLPPVINGCLALMAGTLSFWLPETNNQAMTSTVEEFERKYAHLIGKKFEDEKDEISETENPGFQDEEL